MDHPSVRRQRLWEAMESCRKGTDDLSDPEFADLADRLAEDPELRGQFQRLQETDEAIQAAFTDVPVPAGLADRVSRRLAEAAQAGSQAAESACGIERSARCDVPCPASRSRRSGFHDGGCWPDLPHFGRRCFVGRGLDPDSSAAVRNARLRASKRPWTSSTRMTNLRPVRLTGAAAGRISHEP